VIATYHVQRSLNCMGDLSDRLDVWIKQESGDPGVAAYLRGLRDTLSAMQRDYREHLGGRTPEDIIRHAREVAEKFRVVIREDAGCELCPEAMSYINDLNGVISLEEDQGRRFGTWARKLLQQAASAGVAEPKAAGYGRQIRSVLREHLRYRQYEAPGTAGNPGSLLPAK
jgi:hypothetical protein